MRRLIAGGLFRLVPFDQPFLHPFKYDIRSTFNGMIEHEGQPRDERKAGDGWTPKLDSGVAHVGKQWLGVFDGCVDGEGGEGPDREKKGDMNQSHVPIAARECLGFLPQSTWGHVYSH